MTPAAHMRARRARFTAAGLTTQGTPRKNKRRQFGTLQKLDPRNYHALWRADNIARGLTARGKPRPS